MVISELDGIWAHWADVHGLQLVWKTYNLGSIHPEYWDRAYQGMFSPYLYPVIDFTGFTVQALADIRSFYGVRFHHGTD